MMAVFFKRASGETIFSPSEPRYEPAVAKFSKARKNEGEQSGYVGTSSAFAPTHISEAWIDSAREDA